MEHDQLIRRPSRSTPIGHHSELDLPVDEAPTSLNLLSSLGCAAVLLDASGEVIGQNSRAERLFGAELKVSGKRVLVADRQSAELLKDLIRTGVSGLVSSHAVLLPPVMIRRRDARPIVAQILHASGLTGPGGEQARALLLLTPLDGAPEIPETRLVLLFSLTPAEARLAARIGCGDALEDIAGTLNISLGTARNQLKSIFSKTGTKRQSELVALLWRVSDLALSTSLIGR